VAIIYGYGYGRGSATVGFRVRFREFQAENRSKSVDVVSAILLAARNEGSDI
jgi:hypothetical protein